MQRKGDPPLNETSSLWTVVSRAAVGLSQAAAAARQQLLDRLSLLSYCRPALDRFGK